MAVCGCPGKCHDLYALVKETGLENVQVVLSGETPGGEGPKVASPGRRPRGLRLRRGSMANIYYQQQPQRRRGLFGRRWFQPTVLRATTPRYAPRGDYYICPPRRDAPPARPYSRS